MSAYFSTMLDLGAMKQLSAVNANLLWKFLLEGEIVRMGCISHIFFKLPLELQFYMHVLHSVIALTLAYPSFWFDVGPVLSDAGLYDPK